VLRHRRRQAGLTRSGSDSAGLGGAGHFRSGGWEGPQLLWNRAGRVERRPTGVGMRWYQATRVGRPGGHPQGAAPTEVRCKQHLARSAGAAAGCSPAGSQRAPRGYPDSVRPAEALNGPLRPAVIGDRAPSYGCRRWSPELRLRRTCQRSPSPLAHKAYDSEAQRWRHGNNR
jgi:hypothetical protein